MIVFDRNRTDKPEFWDSPQFQSFLRDWCGFHSGLGGTRATQQRAPHSVDLEHFRQQAFWPLHEATQGRCAYTEQDLGYEGEDAMVVFHRPLADALDERSQVSPQHYWWALCDWRNWLPASRQVQLTKGTQFPVAGPRSPVPESDEVPSGDWLDQHRDRGLLLDPRHDHPAWHLDYRPDGTVQALRHPSERVQGWAPGRQRGEISIRLLDLNREDLVTRRSQNLNRLQDTVRPMLHLELLASGEMGLLGERRASMRQVVTRVFLEILPEVGNAEAAPAFVEAYAEDLAAALAFRHEPIPENAFAPDVWRPVRDVWHRQWPELTDSEADRLLRIEAPQSLSVEAARGFVVEDDIEDDIEEDIGEDIGEDTEEGSAADEAAPVSRSPTRSVETAPETTELPSHLTSERIIERSARVEHFRIENFKAIDTLEWDLRKDGITIPARYGLPEGSQSAVNWTVFLGENGSGKSCCMQAIGLALAGDQLDGVVEVSGLDWGKILRRGTGEGRVYLRFTGGTEVDLRFDGSRQWWQGGAPKMAGFVRGYGATRLLEAEKDESATPSDSNVRVANLIDPRARVLDAEDWLLELYGKSRGDFNAVALTLKGFLGADGARLGGEEASEERPFLDAELDANGSPAEILVAGEPLSYASDGYRSVVALVCDIMAGLGVGLSDLRNANGIVLIDEIGAHLHPRWKMEITSRLRREFPQLQFFVSTHEPLCLRGLGEKEVFRVRKRMPKEEASVFAGRVELERIERSPSDFRVDQLLTSEFFGLDTTIDPELDRRFQAYYRLRVMTRDEREATPLRWNPKETLQDEYLRLGEYLERATQPVLGFTRRDQLMFEAIDDYLAGEKKRDQDEGQPAAAPVGSPVNELVDEPRESPQHRRRRVLERIQDIWQPPDSLMQVGRRPS